MLSFPLFPLINPRFAHRSTVVLLPVWHSRAALTLGNMTKRKRTWTDEAPDALPESSSQSVGLANAKDGVLEVLPGITRKITACGACRKQKVRCDCLSSWWAVSS